MSICILSFVKIAVFASCAMGIQMDNNTDVLCQVS